MGRRKKRDEDATKSKEVITVGFVECTCGWYQSCFNGNAAVDAGVTHSLRHRIATVFNTYGPYREVVFSRRTVPHARPV